MAVLKLTQNRLCLVDDSDIARLSHIRWHAHKDRWGKWYALGKFRGKPVRMHRFLLNPPDNVEIDHINGDGLNNHRHNLRICVHKDNVRNQKKRTNNLSGFKGVYFHKKTKKWAASICAGKIIHLGLFKTSKEAAMAYDSAAERLHGEFCLTNSKLKLL